MALHYFKLLQQKYLNVKFTVAPDGTLFPYRIDSSERQYFIIVLRFREMTPSRWRYTVKIDGRKMYLYRVGHEWWTE